MTLTLYRIQIHHPLINLAPPTPDAKTKQQDVSVSYNSVHELYHVVVQKPSPQAESDAKGAPAKRPRIPDAKSPPAKKLCRGILPHAKVYSVIIVHLLLISYYFNT